jgi:hypothetical protein
MENPAVGFQSSAIPWEFLEIWHVDTKPFAVNAGAKA